MQWVAAASSAVVISVLILVLWALAQRANPRHEQLAVSSVVPGPRRGWSPAPSRPAFTRFTTVPQFSGSVTDSLRRPPVERSGPRPHTGRERVYFEVS